MVIFLGVRCYTNSFTVDMKVGEKTYTYVFQLCGDAGGVQGAGVIQTEKGVEKKTIVGRYNSTTAIGGSEY